MNQLKKSVGICIASLMLIGTSGCGPTLDNVQTLDLDPNEIRTILLAPSSKAQDVNVVAKADGVKLKVFVYLFEDDEVVSRAITLDSASDKILASKTDSSDIKLVASIPANKEAAIQLHCEKATKVTLTINN